MADEPKIVITIPEDMAPEWEHAPVDDRWFGILDDDEPLTSNPGEYLGIPRELVPPGATPGIHDSVLVEVPTALVDAPTREIQLPDELPIGRAPFEYLCGTAGTGKSTMARALIQRQPGVVLAATTGIAAVNLGEGTTINALLKYFNTEDLREKYVSGQLHTTLRRLWRAGLRRIVLDEVSMLSADALTYITRAIAETNERPDDSELAAVGTDDIQDEDTSSRGGGRAKIADDPIGLTLVGDFGQLPPVADSEEYKDPKTGEKKLRKLPVRFAFESPEWSKYAPHVTKLTKIWRQDAQDFIAALHAVRRGDKAAALQFFTDSRFQLATDDTFDGTTIVAKNDEVDRYNQLRLDALTTPVLQWDTSREGKQREDWKQIPPTVTVKEKALVMLLANRRVYDDPDDPDDMGRLVYANGDLGYVLGRDSMGRWRVRLKRNGSEQAVFPVTRENQVPLDPGRRKELKELYPNDWQRYISEDGKYEVVGRITYMPVRVAYACTVHKTQGLTLDAVQVNIRDWMFKQPGMLFVALSRARTADGLRIVGNQRGFLERCTVESRVVPWL